MEESIEKSEAIEEKTNSSDKPKENPPKKDGKSRTEELIKKYRIDIEKLKSEQEELSKNIEIKDRIDFKLSERFGAVDNTFIGNKLLSCIIVCDKDYEIVDRAYSFETAKFPYIPGFRNYRELIPMMIAFEKLNERPDVMFVPANGITHQRLGLSSHFSLSTGVPTIGISNTIVGCEIEDGDILKDSKKVGKVLITKENSKPMFVSPGNLITIKSSFELCQNMINLPHKRPEPLHLAGKYAREVRKELAL